MHTPSRTLAFATYFVAQLAVVVGLIALWQHGSDTGALSELAFSSPHEIWRAFTTQFSSGGTLLRDIWSTLELLIIGQVIGTLAGGILGCILAFSSLWSQVLSPFVVFLNAVPRLILYPFFVIWLGFGATPKVVTVALVVLTIVAISVASGLDEVEHGLVDNLKALGASRAELGRHLYLPSLSLWLISTSRVAMSYSFQTTVTVQFVGANVGLGYLINSGRNTLNLAQVYMAVGVTVALALGLDAILSVVERRASRWMEASPR